MNETEFNDSAEKLLFFIAETIEDEDPEGKIDIDLNNGILNLKNHSGIYVINKHSAAKEVWVSSPISGPFHFKNKDLYWVNKDNINMLELLGQELGISFLKNN